MDTSKTLCGENDQAGRPPVPWDQWTTHCRLIRNQEHRIVPCCHPVEYRGRIYHQMCPDDCFVVRKYRNGKERKTTK